MNRHCRCPLPTPNPSLHPVTPISPQPPLFPQAYINRDIFKNLSHLLSTLQINSFQEGIDGDRRHSRVHINTNAVVVDVTERLSKFVSNTKATNESCTLVECSHFLRLMNPLEKTTESDSLEVTMKAKPLPKEHKEEEHVIPWM
ncbi:hypothetical protein U1Q18_039018 [Sarracenia purpurea var. burkii]